MYDFVKAYGISPDRLAQNALRQGKKVSADDNEKLPIDLGDSLTEGDFLTGDSVVMAARQMYAEELFVSPRMRQHFRIAYYGNGWMSCRRTEKGLRRIDEAHPFYEIKYLINQTINDLARTPDIYLKMMKAEEEGLIEVQLTLQNEREFRRSLYSEFASDNFSERADSWERGTPESPRPCIPQAGESHHQGCQGLSPHGMPGSAAQDVPRGIHQAARPGSLQAQGPYPRNHAQSPRLDQWHGRPGS